MCARYAITFDGHDYTLRVDATNHITTILDAEQTVVGTVETSPCGEYYILASHDNPLGMAAHHHIHSITLEEAACSVIAGSY